MAPAPTLACGKCADTLDRAGRRSSTVLKLKPRKPGEPLRLAQENPHHPFTRGEHVFYLENCPVVEGLAAGRSDIPFNEVESHEHLGRILAMISKNAMFEAPLKIMRKHNTPFRVRA